MKIVFCSEPFYPDRPDYCYEKEAGAAANRGLEYELFSFEDLTEGKLGSAFRRIKPAEKPEPALYRGWMLTPRQYETLYDQLKTRNLHLINSPEEYRHCHYFPESYGIIKDHTPVSVFLPYDENFGFDDLMGRLSVFGDKPLILKDYVKSRKHEWEDACFIVRASDRSLIERVVGRFLELQGDDLNEGLVFREFIEFEPLAEHSKSGMPLTREFRLFFLEGRRIHAAEYWEEGDYAETGLPEDLFAEVAKNVQSNFFSIDVARRKDGQWMIIELGDGQVAGLPERADEGEFYDSLRFSPFDLWRQDDNGHRFLIETFPCRADAVRAMRDFEVRGHKQTYWIERKK
ncbi:MAG: ATP-grasp domain-containing protein [Pyrinomonadaceae bacterium]